MKPKTPTQRSNERHQRERDGKVIFTAIIPKTKVTKVKQAVKRIIEDDK